MLGREMQTLHPMVPLAHRQALCVGIMSYNGQLNYGLVGDYDAMEDLDDFRDHLQEAIDETIASAPAQRKRKRAASRKGTSTSVA